MKNESRIDLIFCNDFARNVIIFGIDNSSSSHADNQKNNFLVLGEWPTYGINRNFGEPEKSISIIFGKAMTKCCLSLLYNGDNSYLFVNGKEIFKFKANNGNLNLPTQFYRNLNLPIQLFLGSISNKIDAIDSTKISLKGNAYDLSVDYNSIDIYIYIYIYIYIV